MITLLVQSDVAAFGDFQVNVQAEDNAQVVSAAGYSKQVTVLNSGADEDAIALGLNFEPKVYNWVDLVAIWNGLANVSVILMDIERNADPGNVALQLDLAAITDVTVTDNLGTADVQITTDAVNELTYFEIEQYSDAGYTQLVDTLRFLQTGSPETPNMSDSSHFYRVRLEKRGIYTDWVNQS